MFLKKKLKIFPLNKLLKRYFIGSPENKLAKMAYSFINYYDGEEVTRNSHICSLKYSHDERFAKAKQLLEIYANARCVFTSRIHCALPCLALGTPVILITKTNDSLRYQGISRFLNHIWIENDGKVVQEVATNNGEVINTDLYLEKALELRKTCFDFVRS